MRSENKDGLLGHRKRWEMGREVELKRKQSKECEGRGYLSISSGPMEGAHGNGTVASFAWRGRGELPLRQSWKL